VTCPHCDQAAPYHGDRPRRPLSLFGLIRYSRAYYYCRRCGQGRCPFDDDAGLSDRNLTPAAEQLATLAGAVADSFGKGADLLEEMAGLRLSESTVQRTTEDAGARLAALLAAGTTCGPRVQWDWQRDARGRTVAYVTVDATGTRQQGSRRCAPGGRCRPCRHATSPACTRWRSWGRCCAGRRDGWAWKRPSGGWR
jgi:hypothetical protein